jgi:arsenate reductase
MKYISQRTTFFASFVKIPTMMKYYHNPRCSKSREGLQLLESKGVALDVVKYMENPITPTELQDLLDKLDLDAADLLRTNEKIWKEEFADKELSDDEIFLLLIEYPQLMQRPILESETEARIGRPVEQLLELLPK